MTTNTKEAPAARRGRPTWVQNAHHKKILYADAEALMDEGIKRYVDAYVFNGKHVRPQQFFNAYCVYHSMKLKETFVCNREEWGE